MRDFALQSGFNIMANAALADGKHTGGFTATADPETALRTLLAGSGLEYYRDGYTIVITSKAVVTQPEPQTGTPTPAPVKADDKHSARSALEEIIVTAQKMEEGIQDVPIAVSASTDSPWSREFLASV